MEYEDVETLRANDFVYLTEAALHQGLQRNAKSRRGIFLRPTRRGMMWVVRDGQKTPSEYHPKFWQKERPND